jgi:integrase
VLRLLVAHEGLTYSHLRGMKYAIAKMHDDGPDPAAGEGVKKFLQGYARLYSRRQKPVDALRPGEFRAIADAAPGIGGRFVTARLRFMLTVSYAGWLRGSETCALRGAELLCNRVGYGALVGPAKGHDQEFVPLELPAGSGTTVGDELRRYVAAAKEEGVSLGPSQPLFPALGGNTRALSYDRYLEDLHKAAAAAGITRHITTHSTRRGGASECARALPADDALTEIMRRGRWVSVDVAMAYVDEWDGFAPELQLDYPASSSWSPSAQDQSSSNQPASSM